MNDYSVGIFLKAICFPSLLLNDKGLIVIMIIADGNRCFTFFSLIILWKIKINLLKNNRGIPEKNARQFQTEIETWKELLNTRMEENVLLKNRLSDILINNYDQNSLEEIEEFQTKFIREDELINSLRRDVNNLDNLLYSKMFEDGKMEKSFDTGMEKLGKDIANSITRFRILQSAFDDFQHKIFCKREN